MQKSHVVISIKIKIMLLYHDNFLAKIVEAKPSIQKFDQSKLKSKITLKPWAFSHRGS